VQDSVDAVQLRKLGYKQTLRRGLTAFDNVVIGFATISPVVGLYAVYQIGNSLAGPLWLWVLPICLAGQCLVLHVYCELAQLFPVAGAPYQWTSRLTGPKYAWFTGWLALWGYLAANTTIGYLAAPWIAALFGLAPTANTLILLAAGFICICGVLNAQRIDSLRWILHLGVAAEALAMIGVGTALLIFFRSQHITLLSESLEAETGSGGSLFAALLAATAVGGWVFIGFDACAAVSEETRRPHRNVPRGMWSAVLSVALLVMLNAVAVSLAHPAPERVVSGADTDPVSTAVVTAFGSWSAKPFGLVVLIAFFSCGLCAQGLTARTLFSIARDDVLPGSRWLRVVNSRQSPVGAVVVVTIVSTAGLALGIDHAAIGSLIAFGTGTIYVVLLLIVGAALIARRRDNSALRGKGLGSLAINVAALLWLIFEAVNIALPRRVMVPPDAPWYQIWAVPLILGTAVLAGSLYLALARRWAKTR
jgi:amino acid transporter